MSKILIPSLTINDTIQIVSPSGSFQGDINGIKKIAEKYDLKIKYSNKAFGAKGYFSASDIDRLTDLQEAIDNPEIKALLCSRGGYGVTRIIDKLDLSKLMVSPKWIIGFSDITALHLALNKVNIPSIHGPMIKHISEDETSASRLFNFLTKAELDYKLPSNSFNILGKTSGEIVGGNLSLVLESLGTPTQIETKGKILFLEEIGEPLYRIDRMLNQLERAGLFDGIKGLIVGQFTDIIPMTKDFGLSLQQAIKEKVKKNIPIAFDFPSGHSIPNYSLPFGINLTFSVSKEYITLDTN